MVADSEKPVVESAAETMEQASETAPAEAGAPLEDRPETAAEADAQDTGLTS